MKLRQTGTAPQFVLDAFTSGEIGLDRAYLLTQLAETGLTDTELAERSTDYSLGKLWVEWTKRRRLDQETCQEQFDNRYLIIQPNLDNSVQRFWGQAIGTDGEAIIRAIGKRETELPVLEDETRGQRQLDALASICLDSLTGTGAEGRAVTVAEVIIDGRLAAQTNGEAGVTLATGPKVGPETLEEILCGGQARIITSGEHSVSYSDRGECIPPAIRLLVLNRDGHRCGIDGCASQYRLQPHHILPRSQGGSHHPDNLITLCWYHHHVAIHGRGMQLDPESPTHRRKLLWPAATCHGPPVPVPV